MTYKPYHWIIMGPFYLFMAQLVSCGNVPAFVERVFPDERGDRGSASDSFETLDQRNTIIIDEQGDASQTMEPVDSRDLDEGNATDVLTDSQGLWLETFRFGNDSVSPLVDYLIILDNSCSMEQIISRVASGFSSLIGSDVLPERAKLAVMNTMHGHDNNLNLPGIGINTYPGIEREPGFLDFVNRDAIISYRELVPQYRQQWPRLGCPAKWFSLDEKSSEGDSCLVAATQATFHCVGAEAGIRAFKQLLVKHDEGSLFRQGTNLNVIFVSDTHDPGTNIDYLKQTVPSYEEVIRLANDSHILGGIKFHALAPDTRCTSEGLHDRSYHELVERAGGLWQNPCYLDDYNDFMAAMAKSSSEKLKPVFTLSRKASDILAVKVNGEAITDYDLVGEQSIVINSLKTDLDYEISIRYRSE